MSISKYNEQIPKLYCIRYKRIDLGCNPTKCTALKLKKLNLVKLISRIGKRLNKAILLNPFSQKEISIEDKSIIIKFGLIVIDCSWKKIFNFKDLGYGNNRKLPPLIATNPTNYGKWEKLSSAEALASALYITDFNDYADLILSKFSWGSQFKKINNF